MGRGKSSFLNVLGSPWYASLPEGFGTKEFLQAIQGRWLIEIPDMTGFSRRDHNHIIATITTRTDVYRAAYGRYVEEHPRSCVFAATSETDDYLEDIRGRRRYWPLRCTDIDVDLLRAIRTQVFAEAVRAYKNGADYWTMPGQTNDEQLARSTPDLWTDRIVGYCNLMISTDQKITSAKILTDAIEMPLARQTDSDKKRLARIMYAEGFIHTRTKDERCWVKKKRIEQPKG